MIIITFTILSYRIFSQKVLRQCISDVQMGQGNRSHSQQLSAISQGQWSWQRDKGTQHFPRKPCGTVKGLSYSLKQAHFCRNIVTCITRLFAQ